MGAGLSTYRKLTSRVPSSAISETGLLSTTDLIGSARLGVKPIFPIPRWQLFDEINNRRFPPPLRITESGLFFEAITIKRFVEMLEAQVEPEPEQLPSDWVPIRELAQELGVTRPALYDRIARGVLPAPARFQGRVGWSRATLTKFVASGGAL